MIKSDIIDDIKHFQWKEIISHGNRLEDLNDAQWRFLKGLVAELLVEKYSGIDGLTRVGQPHYDYVWDKHQIRVELKSLFSAKMYDKYGKVKNNFTVKLNNSNGTNKKEKMSADEVAEILLVVYNDGAFAVDQTTVIERSQAGGDGFVVKLKKTDIIEISGKMSATDTTSFDLKEKISNAIRESIQSL